jgi:D-glycero-alpha-D-manno-heptose-7-phosphate kinase
MIITRTPFRVSFFGGGTDYRPWFSQHGGLVVGTTIQRYCHIFCRRLPPFFEYKTRIVYSKIELVRKVSEILHPSIRGCLTHLKIDDGLEIHHDGDLPARAGLGSSSAFSVGFLLSLHALRHKMPTKRELANEAIEVEQNLLKENVGIQDQIWAAHGGFNAIQITRDGHYEIIPILLPPNYIDNLEQHVLLGFTGLTHLASELAGVQMKKIESGKSQMREIHSIAQTALDQFRANADISKIGELLDQSWRVKRSLADGITSSDIDAAYNAARKAGAYGGKVLGAGGGGFIMFMAPPDRHERIKEALRHIKVWVPYRIDRTGAQVIFHTDEM